MNGEDYRYNWDLVGSSSDWDRSGCCCPDYGPSYSAQSYFGDGTLLAVLAAGALAFYVLYSTIMAMGAGMEEAMDLEEFQENVDKIFDNAPVDGIDPPISDETLEGKVPTDECLVEMWRCLARVVEGGLHYIDNPDGLNRLVRTTLLRATFQGRLDKILMGIPEAQEIMECSDDQRECRRKKDRN